MGEDERSHRSVERLLHDSTGEKLVNCLDRRPDSLRISAAMLMRDAFSLLMWKITLLRKR